MNAILGFLKHTILVAGVVAVALFAVTAFVLWLAFLIVIIFGSGEWWMYAYDIVGFILLVSFVTYERKRPA